MCAQIAAELNARAKPSSILIGDTTARLVNGYFDLDDVGEHTFRMDGTGSGALGELVTFELGADGRAVRVTVGVNRAERVDDYD